jgi:transcriptional regulator with XRE-family HTH domain
MPTEYATYPCSVNDTYSYAAAACSATGNVARVDKHDPKDKERLGTRLAACRALKGWKQDFAAKQVGVTKAALSAWETGRNMPDALFLRKLSKLYEVSVDAILWENPVSNEAMQFAAQFDSLTPRQQSTLRTVLMAFVNEGVSDARMEAAYGEAQKRERAANPIKIGPDNPNERRQVVLGRAPERRTDHLVPSPLTHNPPTDTPGGKEGAE